MGFRLHQIRWSARHLIACSTWRLCRAASAGQGLVLERWRALPLIQILSLTLGYNTSPQHSSASFSVFLYSRVFLGNTPLKHSVPTCLHNTSSQTLQRIFSSTFRYKASDTTLLPPTLLSLNTSPPHSSAALSPISPKLHCNISCPFNTVSPRFR